MKRMIMILLVLSMLCLCGCGTPAEPIESAPSSTEISSEEVLEDSSVPAEEETVDLGVGGLPILP